MAKKGEKEKLCGCRALSLSCGPFSTTDPTTRRATTSRPEPARERGEKGKEIKMEQKNFYSCRMCNFVTSDQWYCDLHRKLVHDKLRGDKVQVSVETCSL